MVLACQGPIPENSLSQRIARLSVAMPIKNPDTGMWLHRSSSVTMSETWPSVGPGLDGPPGTEEDAMKRITVLGIATGAAVSALLAFAYPASAG